MIPAKTAKDGTNIDRYIKEKCREIEESIKYCMELGLGYLKYNGNLPESIQEMLKELGYKITIVDNAIMGPLFIISWSDAGESDLKCN